jgi:DMSO/TMAO reductase YedYZ molybdopterin-dependent catalytic subunit
VSTARRRGAGAAIGLLTTAVALGVASFAAAFVGEVTSPVVAVGQAAIDAAPAWLKEFAIRTFGMRDKLALLVGIGVVLVIVAMVLGVVALRRPWVGRVGLVAFGALGVAAALSRPSSDALSPLPSVVGIAAGWVALGRLLREAPVAPPARGERPTDHDRRRFLATGAALGGLAAVAGVGSWVVGRTTSKADASRAALHVPTPTDTASAPPGADLRVPGLGSFFTPNDSFYRVDTALIVPKVPAQDWRLRIHGMVDREVSVDLRGLLARPLVERDITLTCVSNEVGGPYVGNARWIGALLRPLLDEAGVHAEATQLVSRSAEGFTVGTPTAVVMDGRDAMLAVAMNGQPLPLAHGFPVRMVVPGLYGYVSATKWVVDMELTTFEAFDAYWVQRGWARQAPIKTESRIDTPRSGARVPAGRVAVAGVAWAQHRGISRVDVRVDGGPWRTARLGEQDAVDTWRQWVFPWEATAGRHMIQVRATDRDGSTQTSQAVPPIPNGATGWHTIVVQAA